jgi:transcriptional regulator with XRE-family HTH domain
MHDRIRTIRNSLGLNQDEFAARISISRSALTKLERGINNPSEQTLKLICREFSIDYLWLKTGEGEMIEKPTVEGDMALFHNIMTGDDEFAKSLFRAYVKLGREDWRRLRIFMQDFLNEATENEQKKEESP